jgi:hypothetical protein
MRDLAVVVHEASGLPLHAATQQVLRIIEQFDVAGLLTSSGVGPSADEAIAGAEIFIGSSTPCSENASRLGTESLHLRFDERVVRVACDSRRATRRLRDALANCLAADRVDDAEEPPLAFVLTAPQGLKRHHELTDRSGFTLSTGRGLDAGLSALGSHLTALLPPAPRTVRIRARTLVAEEHTVVCLPPLLYVTPIDERTLRRQGIGIIDRLALDIDVETGCLVNPEIPWPALARLRNAGPHVGVGGTRVIDVVVDTRPPGDPTPTPATAVARLAASGVHGSPAELLDVATRIVETAELRSTTPGTDAFLDVVLGREATGSDQA